MIEPAVAVLYMCLAKDVPPHPAKMAPGTPAGCYGPFFDRLTAEQCAAERDRFNAIAQADGNDNVRMHCEPGTELPEGVVRRR